MLSKLDIQNELGKGISIYPLNLKNFKENSINLCTGNYAWTLGEGKIYFNKKSQEFSLVRNSPEQKEITFYRGNSAIYKVSVKEQYIVLLPQSTTLIETKEVLSVGPNIGGTYHSKVGLVSQGTGHIGTMLGPNFSGNSLIALHNITNNIISLSVGESFVSVVFHYLDTPIYDKNPTVSGHVDKMSELGIKLTQKEREDISADWKERIESVREVMINSEEYKNFQKQQKKERTANIKYFFNKENIGIAFILIVIISILIFGSYWLDSIFNNSEWSNRCWNIICSGVLVTIIGSLMKNIKKRK